MNYAMTLAAGLVLSAPLAEARSADDRQATPHPSGVILSIRLAIHTPIVAVDR